MTADPVGRQLDGHVAVITGGANGLGREFALNLAARGCAIVIGDIAEDTAAALAAEIEKAGGAALSVRCDVAKDADLELLAARAFGRFGHVDFLFNHAGYALAGPVERIPVADWTHLLDVNVVGVVRGLKAFLPRMIGRGRGHIAITSSSLGLFADNPIAAPYIASKAALVGLGRALSAYLAPLGLKVSVLCPDLTDTDFPRRVKIVGIPSPPELPLPDGAQSAADAAERLLSAMLDGGLLVSATANAGHRLRSDIEAILVEAAPSGATS